MDKPLNLALQNLQAVGQMKQKQGAQREAENQMAEQFKKLISRDDASQRSSNFNSSNNIQSCYSFLSGSKNQVYDGEFFEWKNISPLQQLNKNSDGSPQVEEHKGEPDSGKNKPLGFSSPLQNPYPSNQQPAI